MTITHLEGWMPEVITQSNYPTLGEVYFLGWFGEAFTQETTIAIFRIKYKV